MATTHPPKQPRPKEVSFGHATAPPSTREGAKVVAVDCDEEKGQRAPAEVLEHRGDASFVQTDVSSPYAAKGMIKKRVEVYGRLDVIFSNANVVGQQLPRPSAEAFDA